KRRRDVEALRPRLRGGMPVEEDLGIARHEDGDLGRLLVVAWLCRDCRTDQDAAGQGQKDEVAKLVLHGPILLWLWSLPPGCVRDSKTCVRVAVTPGGCHSPVSAASFGQYGSCRPPACDITFASGRQSLEWLDACTCFRIPSRL